MATHILTNINSITNNFLAELRDINIQKDSWRFRKNLERLSMVMAVELSKTLNYHTKETETPLGISASNLLSDSIVIASILRAGIPMHNGFLEVFDQAESAFVSAQRKVHKTGNFDIELSKVSAPELSDKVLVLCDPMLATGASIDVAIQALKEYGTPASIHICAAIGSRAGKEHIERLYPDAQLWIGDLDEELTGKSYIVPGLGDAGDLAFGQKI